MVDREKVINELVEHIESALAVDSDYVDCVHTDLLQYTVALLKERESVKPRKCQYLQGTYACGFCDYIPIGNKDGYRANYCPECGKAVKWDE